MGRIRPSTANFERRIAKAVASLDTQIAALGPKQSSGRVGLLGVIDQVSHDTGRSIEELRVLEIGAGSGKLADGLMKREGIKPENYVIGDITYGTDEAPALQRSVYSHVKKGRMRALQLDIFEDPGDIGKFDLIAVPFVLGTPEFLNALLDNYFGKLTPGGIMVVTSAERSNYLLKRLMERVAKDPYLREDHQLMQIEIEALELNKKLNDLRERKLISEFTNPQQLFHPNADKDYTLTFLIQKNKNQ